MKTVLTLHQNWFWVATVSTGGVGLWGLALASLKRTPGRVFAVGRALAIGAMLVQVGLGLTLYAQDLRPDSFHIFYGFVIVFTFSFAYIYRPQLAKRPALSYGLLLLFVMGLGLRAWSNVA
ncbi:MAG: hypothetical protein OEM22_04930 [Acidimicrobiia bacterium]|nr:hypothetical protein [Acidimicrobiia bacterium]MDH3470554.1 hypothetical protein [Acidimicrobiia bacterium]